MFHQPVMEIYERISEGADLKTCSGVGSTEAEAASAGI